MGFDNDYCQLQLLSEILAKNQRMVSIEGAGLTWQGLSDVHVETTTTQRGRKVTNNQVISPAHAFTHSFFGRLDAAFK
jgi:hypothetical protein